MIVVCRTLHVGAPGVNSDAALGAPTKLGRAPSKEVQRRDAPNSPPARRVGAKRGVCGVAALGNGLAIACALRLASIPVWLQRIPRAKSGRLLSYSWKALLPLTLSVAALAASAQVTYRCGNSYSQTPCPGAVEVDTRDTRTGAQKAQTDLATQRDTRTANALEKARLLQESKDRAANTASKPATVAPATKNRGKPAKAKKLDGSAELVVKSPPRPKKPASAASAPRKGKA